LNSAGVAVGAVGVTGDSGDMDEFFAVAGVQEAGPLQGIAGTEPSNVKIDPRIKSKL
jgi:hypothetical protein